VEVLEVSEAMVCCGSTEDVILYLHGCPAFSDVLDDFSCVALLSVFLNTVVLVPFNSILRPRSSTLPLLSGHGGIRGNSLSWIIHSVRLSNLAKISSRLKALQRKINLA